MFLALWTSSYECTWEAWSALKKLGSISADLSCQVYPRGEEHELISRTAAGNRAYQKARVALGYHLEQLLCFFCALQTSHIHP